MWEFIEICYTTTFSASSPYKNNFFNALFLNIRSLRNRISDLSAYIHTNPRKIHVIVLNETRLKPNDAHLFSIPGYFSFHSVRDKIGGGVSIFVLKEFSSTNCLENFEFENSNFLIINLCDLNLKIGGFYKPPDTNTIRFIERLNSIIEKYSDIFCFGDFNINLFDDNSSVRKYTETIELNGSLLLYSLDKNMFTRQNLTTGTRTCIDHIFTDLSQRFNFLFATDDILNVDHKALLLSIHNPHNTKKTLHVGKYFDFKKTDHEKKEKKKNILIDFS